MNLVSKNSTNLLFIILLLELFFLAFDFKFFSSIGFGVFALVLFLHRKPNRETILSTGVVTSPIDGNVVSIDIIKDKICIKIETSIIDASIVRSPIESKIGSIKKICGIYLSNISMLSKYLNEKVSICFDTHNIELEFIASTMCVGGISFYPKEKGNVDFGEEIGFMMQGYVLLYLDKDSLLKINLGDKLKASQSIIASLPASS